MKKSIFLALAGVLIFGMFFLNRGMDSFSEMRLMMDTMISIRVFGQEGLAKTALNKGFSQFAEVEKFASFHLADSETAVLNRQNRIIPSSQMKSLLDLSQKAFEETDGYFDPTFAVLQKAYGFYNPDSQGRKPTEEELKELLALTGFSKKSGYVENSHEFLLATGTIVDFGGIAGGYAVMLAAKAIRDSGSKAFLIDDAGDIWFEGVKPDKKPWKIAIKDPRNTGVLALIESFEPVAISTSGNYERFVKVGDERLGHIMSPFSGKPANDFQSVTVVASNPVDADVFSTAAFAMPEEIAVKWTENRNIAALFLTADNRMIVNGPGKIWFKAIKQ